MTDQEMIELLKKENQALSEKIKQADRDHSELVGKMDKLVEARVKELVEERDRFAALHNAREATISALEKHAPDEVKIALAEYNALQMENHHTEVGANLIRSRAAIAELRKQADEKAKAKAESEKAKP